VNSRAIQHNIPFVIDQSPSGYKQLVKNIYKMYNSVINKDFHVI
jgi:hypothetical protein